MFFFEGGNSVYTCKFLRASIEIIYIYDYICLPSKSKPHQYCEPPCIVQVLKTLEKIGGSTAPFALQEQYVPAVLAGKGGESDDESSDGDKENKKAPPKKKQKKQKAASKKPSKPKNNEPRVQQEESTWNYNSIRSEFITKARIGGKTYKEAKNLWDDSMEKARYLAPVGVGELKKRRFLPVGSTLNPWHQKVHGPTN